MKIGADAATTTQSHFSESSKPSNERYKFDKKPPSIPPDGLTNQSASKDYGAGPSSRKTGLN